jgi:hypothetical protein
MARALALSLSCGASCATYLARPRPTCTADSSAALTATAPVRSLLHAWPCSAPLQPLLPLPFPAPPLGIFCAHLTFHHSLSCRISHFPHRFSNAFLTALCPFTALIRGLRTFHLSVCPEAGTVGNASFFPKSPKTLQSDNFHLLLHVMCCISKLIESTCRQQNQVCTPVVFD